MADGSRDYPLDPELDKALADLLEQSRREELTPRLRELIQRLEEALSKAQKKRRP